MTAGTAPDGGDDYDFHNEYGLNIDVELMDDLIVTYGWLFKPLEPLDSFNYQSGFSERDIRLLNSSNEILLEYLEDHAKNYDDLSEIPDRKIIVHVADGLADIEDTSRQNMYQWITPHIRLEYNGAPSSDEWIHIDDHKEKINEVSQKRWEDGFADAHERLTSKD